MNETLSIVRFIQTISFLTLFVFSAYSQQGNYWFFGERIGLSFNSGSPIYVQGGQIQSLAHPKNQEGCATISDKNGDLLFYTDGESVWNHHHQLMPNGVGLLGHRSSSQAAIIIPQPGVACGYYIFHTDAFLNGFQNGLRYSLVDMSMQNGFGDVVLQEKNIPLLDTASEKLAAVRHNNGLDYWVVTQQHFTNKFYAFLVTLNGIQPPIISSFGPTFGTSAVEGIGQSKFSPDGTHYAIVLGQGPNTFAELLDFDASTGFFSNSRIIPTSGSNIYGVEFSNNSCMLYISEATTATQINQFDVCSGAGHLDSIIASRKIIPIPFGCHGLQMAPDGKIYGAQGATVILSIDSPDLAYPQCSLNLQAVNFGSLEVDFTFPSFISGYDYDSVPTCLNTNISKLSNPLESVYPIPVKFQFRIPGINPSKITKIQVIDIFGKNWGSLSIDSNDDWIQFPYPSGIFFLKVLFGNSSEEIFYKLIKQ